MAVVLLIILPTVLLCIYCRSKNAAKKREVRIEHADYNQDLDKGHQYECPAVQLSPDEYNQHSRLGLKGQYSF